MSQMSESGVLLNSVLTVSDVVGPGQAVALSTTSGIPVVVQRVKRAPLSLPCLKLGLKWRARVRAVAVAGDQTKVLGLASTLDASKALAVLLPAAAITASNLGVKASSSSVGARILMKSAAWRPVASIEAYGVLRSGSFKKPT